MPSFLYTGPELKMRMELMKHRGAAKQNPIPPLIHCWIPSCHYRGPSHNFRSYCKVSIDKSGSFVLVRFLDPFYVGNEGEDFRTECLRPASAFRDERIDIPEYFDYTFNNFMTKATKERLNSWVETLRRQTTHERPLLPARMQIVSNTRRCLPDRMQLSDSPSDEEAPSSSSSPIDELFSDSDDGSDVVEFAGPPIVIAMIDLTKES